MNELYLRLEAGHSCWQKGGAYSGNASLSALNCRSLSDGGLALFGTEGVTLVRRAQSKVDLSKQQRIVLKGGSCAETSTMACVVRRAFIARAANIKGCPGLLLVRRRTRLCTDE